jgi:outer membrane protein assembly factor BamE (lipoprotein component of BamABCDE complex)
MGSNKVMKKAFIGLSVLLICGIYYILNRPLVNKKSIQNIGKIKLVKVGLSKDEVFEIMGDPIKTVIHYFDSSQIVYYYETPLYAAGQIQIFFDTTEMRVIKVSDHDDF